jgi:cytochrome c-type biogenesis protein
MIDVGYGAAFLAGLLSFFSPCVLPIVPPYLAYLAGMSFNEVQNADADHVASRRIALASIAFVLGFTTVFVALGATASVIGQSLARYFDILAIIAGILILLMGLHFLGVFRFALLYREARVRLSASLRACCWRLCHGPGLCFWLDALRGADPGGDPVHGCGKRDRGAGRACCSGSTRSESASLSSSQGFSRAVSCGFEPVQETYGMIEKAMGVLLVITGYPVHDRSDVPDRTMAA